MSSVLWREVIIVVESAVSGRVRRFWAGERGAIAIIFALLIIPLLMAVGVAVDYIRAQQAKTALQAVVDAAALAAGAHPLPNPLNAQDSEPVLRVVVDNFVGLNTVDVNGNKIVGKMATLAGAPSLTYTPDPVTDRHFVVVSADATVETVFMRIVDIDTIPISATSEVRRAVLGPLEIALVLDNTHSMRLPVSATDPTTRIDALKSAANSLVDLVMNNPDTLSPAKVGVVPFSGMMRVGTVFRSEPWVEPVPGSNAERCCVEPPPDKICSTDGIPTKCPLQCVDNPPPTFDREGYSCRIHSLSWLGCVAPRPVPYRDNIDNHIAVPYPTNRQNCGSPLLDLTETKADVVASINAMLPASGEGFIPSGLIWGWNMLINEDGTNPLREARSKQQAQADKARKMLILMTDGGNSLVPVSNFFIPSSNVTVSNNLTETVCNNIENDGIAIYTILLGEHPESIQTLIEECASANGGYYTASTAADLTQAFEDIINRLAKMSVEK